MPDFTTHHSSSIIKALIIGDSGSGKTGALWSLVENGFTLRVIDADNGLDILRSSVSPKFYPSILFSTCIDKKGWKNGKLDTKIKPEGWARAMDSLTSWPDDQSNPSDWGPSTVLVIDSLSMLGRHCLNHVLALNGRLGENPSQPEWGTAQRLLENMISLLYSPEVNCNVIVNTHVQIITGDDGAIKWLPNSLGQALAPILPRYFNNMLYVSTKRGTRTLHTQPTGFVATKVTRPDTVKPSYLLTEEGEKRPGLWEFFRDSGVTPQ